VASPPPDSEASIRRTDAHETHSSPVAAGWTLPVPDDLWNAIAGELVLTHRETEIVRAALDNLDTNDIAARLEITPRTVRAHLEHVDRKLGLRNRCDLILMVFSACLRSSSIDEPS
jgi:DNA-binding CsgD family transcriptional regulator